MEDFITKVSVLKNALAATSEKLKESEIILITLGALGNKYESSVTSITTWYDPTMTIASLCELLMDQEMRSQKVKFMTLPMVNVTVKILLTLMIIANGEIRNMLSNLQ